jgi:hypothetical protein
MADTIKSLRAELAELRAEVERLRAWQNGHVCAAPRCTCGSTAMPTACPVHTWTGYISPPNVCGAGAGVPPTITWNPGDPPLNIQYDTAGAAGCAGMTTIFAGI